MLFKNRSIRSRAFYGDHFDIIVPYCKKFPWRVICTQRFHIHRRCAFANIGLITRDGDVREYVASLSMCRLHTARFPIPRPALSQPRACVVGIVVVPTAQSIGRTINTQIIANLANRNRLKIWV